MAQELTPAQLKAQKKQQKQAQRANRKEATQKTAGSVGSPSTASRSQGTTITYDAGDPTLFRHLEVPRPVESAPDAHPAVLHLALQMQRCRVIGSTPRCLAMMDVFTQVIRDYEPPAGTSVGRGLPGYLSRQIEVLKNGRALSVAMGNAIRWLKLQTPKVLDLDDHAAREELVSSIAAFVRERLEVAGRVIVGSAGSHLHSGDCVLTFAHSTVVYETLKASRIAGKELTVICVDSPPLFEGKRLAQKLAELDIPTTYIAISALPYVLDTVTTVLVGAHAMVSNGHLISRLGTSLVAMASAERNIPVLVLCETIKFSERLQLDAFATNETVWTDDGSQHLYYDLTDQSHISKVVTELGALPASSVPVILREYKTAQ